MPASVLSLPSSAHLEFSISMASQLLLLLNSLLLPLIGFIIGAIIAEFFALTEVQQVLSSLIGLVVGIVFCRKFSLTKLNIKEVF
ncbi:MAG: positive regulator of sigma E activity [Candidatus Azotimanducaceae bacterium]